MSFNNATIIIYEEAKKGTSIQELALLFFTTEDRIKKRLDYCKPTLDLDYARYGFILSCRERSTLRFLGINSAEELDGLDIATLLRVPNMGLNTVVELIHKTRSLPKIYEKGIVQGDSKKGKPVSNTRPDQKKLK